MLLLAWSRGVSVAPAVFWLAACPLMATMTAGPRAGFAWLAVVFGCAVGVAWLSHVQPAPPRGPQLWLTRSVAVFMFACMIQACAVVYEHARDTTFGMLVDANLRLEEQRAESERQLCVISELNRDFELEHRVAERAVAKILQRGDFDPAYTRLMLSPSAIFNGDVSFAARTPRGTLRWMLGDFTGHGLVSAIGTIPASSVFYDGTASGLDLTDIIVQLNNTLHTLLPTGLFCASAIMELGPEGQLSVWNGGMPDPFVIRGHSIEHRFASSHLPLGIARITRSDCELQSVGLTLGDRVVSLSDGIPETLAADGRTLGIATAERWLCESMPDVMPRVAAFRGTAQQRDDVSVIEVVYNAALRAATAHS